MQLRFDRVPYQIERLMNPSLQLKDFFFRMKLSVQHLDLTILKTDQAFRFPENRSGVKNREAVSRRGDSQLEHRTAVKDTIPLLIILPQELHVFRKSSAFRPVNHD